MLLPVVFNCSQMQLRAATRSLKEFSVRLRDSVKPLPYTRHAVRDRYRPAGAQYRAPEVRPVGLLEIVFVLYLVKSSGGGLPGEDGGVVGDGDAGDLGGGTG